jgi:hypothetical protein
MADLPQKLEAEFENIERTLAELPQGSVGLSKLELAGVGALLHGFYNGIENVLIQVFRDQGIPLPCGASWHRDLVDTAVARAVISETTAEELRQYLAFRHFFSHAYAVDIRADLLEPLIRTAREVNAMVRNDLEKYST